MVIQVSKFSLSISANSGRYKRGSVVEEDFSPRSQLVSSLVEISSLVEPAGPLNEGSFLALLFFSSEISIVELLFPSLAIIVAEEKRWLDQLIYILFLGNCNCH